MAGGLRMLVLDMPSPVAVGDSLELTCSYDLEGEGLYSVKFYKDTCVTSLLSRFPSPSLTQSLARQSRC